MCLRDEFHNDITVETRNGSVIKGVAYWGGFPRCIGMGMRWEADGSREGEPEYDIVKVLSKPPARKVKEIEVKVGMFVRSPYRVTFEVIGRHVHAVWLYDQATGTRQTQATLSIADWEAVNTEEQKC